MSVVSTMKLVAVGAVVVTLSVEWLAWILRRLRGTTPRPLKEVFFFPSELACVEHLFTPPSSPCPCPLAHGLTTSFSRLLCHLLSASSSLDLCVFAFSNFELKRAVLALHNRGLRIRILTDADYSAIRGSQIGILRKAGICVRLDSGSVHMHHKFAIVDSRRLITGSLNWTMTAVQNNKENIMVTEEPDLVQPFALEFQKLWDVNDLARRHPPTPLSITEKHVKGLIHDQDALK